MLKFFLYFSAIFICCIIYNTYYITSNNESISKVDGNKNFHSIVYTKSQCPYCFKAKNLLWKAKISYQEISLENNIELAEKLLKETNQRTVPYIYINNKFVGGYDQLYELYKNGEI